MTDAVALGVAADSAVAMLLIHPVDDRVLQANNAALDLLGCAANELSGHAFSHFLRGGIALWVSFTDEVLTQGEAWSDDLLLVDLQLRQIAVEVSASAVEGGKIVLAVQRRDLWSSAVTGLRRAANTVWATWGGSGSARCSSASSSRTG